MKGDLETLVKLHDTEINNYKYSLMEGDVSEEQYVHINGLDKRNPSSVLVRKEDLKGFIGD